MFKAIKALFAEQVAPAETVEETIQKIHNEFDTAGEKLLAEAKQILAREDDTSKGEQLKKLGFTNAKQAIQATAFEKQKAEGKEVAASVEYFQQHYPNNKFITEKIVEQICKKYNLLLGEVGDYIGEVPAKNIAEISSFNLREVDQTAFNCSYHDRLSDLRFGTYFLPVPEKSKGNYGYVIRSGFGYQFFGVSPEKEVVYVKPAFKICAPIKDFKTEGKTIKDGYSLIPDPIVLQPVKGGYLIVSKWGLEASDELVVNQKLN